MRQWRAFIVDSRPTVIVRELQFAADPVELRNRQYSLDERRNYHVLPVAEIYLQDKDICVAKPRSVDRGFYLLGQGPVEQSSTNKPLAMRVVEDALAYSKKPPVI